jgi:hypothetical protein
MLILQAPQTLESFSYFPELLLELRLLIWELTWPPPRLIEATMIPKGAHEIILDGGHVETTSFLFLTSPLPTLFSRISEWHPKEYCSPPVALQICQESRTHTLTCFQYMKHAQERLGDFWCDPKCDVLWLGWGSYRGGWEIQTMNLRDLVDAYGEQLRALVISESEVWTSSKFHEQYARSEEITVEYRQREAQKVKLKFAEYLNNNSWAPKGMRCVDRNGKFY